MLQPSKLPCVLHSAETTCCRHSRDACQGLLLATMSIHVV